MKLFESRRPEPEWKNPDPKIRRSAAGRLQEPGRLAEILRSDPDEEVRERARESLLHLALEAPAESGLAALEGLSGEESRLFAVARSASEESVARAALDRLREPKSFGIVARQGKHASLRRAALERIQEVDELAAVALKSEDREIALGALGRVVETIPNDEDRQATVADLLRPVADRAHLRAAARRARALLRTAEGGSETATAQRIPTDRKKQEALCEAMEALSQSREVEALSEEIAATR